MNEDPSTHDVEELAAAIGHDFVDRDVLGLALAHRSWCAENGNVPSNERLEFLGDAVLGLVVTDHSYATYPDFSEGELAKLRAAVVNSAVLADAARSLDLGAHLLLGNGEELTGGRDKQSILADAFEAVIGAVYVDGGLEPARRFVMGTLAERIGDAARVPGVDDHKTRLQEIAARHFDEVPSYRVTEDGPDHLKRFVASVHIGDRCCGHGEGRSKKIAEQAAASDAWRRLHELDHAESDVPHA